jgi:hypothetical protein
MSNEKKYPYYMRLSGTCLKVNSETDLWEITLPPEELVACRAHIRFVDKKELDNYVKVFSQVTQKEFISFLTTFYQSVNMENDKIKT